MTSPTEALAGLGRRPVDPRWLWAVAIVVPTAVRLALFGWEGSPFIDWDCYCLGLDLWIATGTPYLDLPTGWRPGPTLAYIYSPASWPFLLLAVLPPLAAMLGVVPMLLRSPPLRLIPVGALLAIIGLGPALVAASASLIVAGLIALSFRAGRVGGLALALAVAIRPFPLVLLPFLWHDRDRLRWFLGATVALIASSVVLFGPAAWLDWIGLLTRGAQDMPSLSPLAAAGAMRVPMALGVAALGLAVRSPTIALLGATWTNSYVSPHYYLTIAAALPFEIAWWRGPTEQHRTALGLDRFVHQRRAEH